MNHNATEIAQTFPHLPAELVSKLAVVDHSIRTAPTHPEVWMPGNSLDYFLSTGGLAPANHTHVRPYTGGWDALTDGRWQSGGIGAPTTWPHRVS
jgi:hypothetical protein